jgi:hypothetical protein
MTKTDGYEHQLFDAFREDHTKLGKGFFDLCQCLRSGNLDRAKAIAGELDIDVGAHVAFEEQHFYPKLRTLLGDADVDRMEAEHGVGLEVIKALKGLSQDEDLPSATKAKLVQDAETMSTHIAECGELFGAIGRLDAKEQQSLLDQLLAWRERRPRWSEIDAERHR